MRAREPAPLGAERGAVGAEVVHEDLAPVVGREAVLGVEEHDEEEGPVEGFQVVVGAVIEAWAGEERLHRAEEVCPLEAESASGIEVE